jgi:hypothetical protein
MEDEEKTYLNELMDDEREVFTPKQTINKQKSKVITQEVKQELKFSDNYHIADLQQRLIRLEYELLFIKDKLFEESKNSKQEKLSPYGKLIKRRINNG